MSIGVGEWVSKYHNDPCGEDGGKESRKVKGRFDLVVAAEGRNCFDPFDPSALLRAGKLRAGKLTTGRKHVVSMPHACE